MEPNIIAQTEDYYVINKPAGLAVEPPSGSKTLRDWLIENSYINPTEWQESERCGAVHRLDSDTSGVMIWAKNKTAQENLKNLWKSRQVKKTYIGLVVGECQKEGTVELAIERDNKNDKMRVAWLDNKSARPAITTYQRLAVGKLAGEVVSLIKAHPITGRTHQIRVHFNSLDHPLVGDKLYGNKLSARIAKESSLSRHFLHAKEICLFWENSELCYQSPLSQDLITCLKQTDITLSGTIMAEIGLAKS